MTFLTTLIFNVAYWAATLGYPAYQVYEANKQNRIERIWILYFFVFGIFSVLESSLLWPVKFVLVWGKLWNLVKLLLAVWLQHPNYRGALYLEQKFGKYLDLAYEKAYVPAAKVLGMIGVPERAMKASQ